MKKRILVALALLSIGISGCSTSKKVGKDVMVGDALSIAASDIHAELERMNSVSRKPSPPPLTEVSGCSSKNVSLDFDGDIMLFIQDLNDTGICDLRVVGKKPQQDLILSLHHKKVPLWQILEDASVQLGNMASITVGADVVIIQFNGGIEQ